MPESTTRPRGRARIVELAIEVPAVIVTFAMMIHVSANAISRTWLDAPLDNTLEMVSYWYLPLVAFLGFIAAAYRGQHIAADLVYQMLPVVTQKYVLAVLFVVSSVVCHPARRTVHHVLRHRDHARGHHRACTHRRR